MKRPLHAELLKLTYTEHDHTWPYYSINALSLSDTAAPAWTVVLESYPWKKKSAFASKRGSNDLRVLPYCLYKGCGQDYFSMPWMPVL